MLKNFTTIPLVLAAVLWAPHALALDGYQDRKGPLVGAAIGGGYVASATEASVRGDRNGMGLAMGARVGGGVSDGLTLDLSFLHLGTAEKEGDVEIRSAHLHIAVGANLFLTDNLFLRGGIGLGNGALNDEAGDASTEKTDTSLAVFGGAGLEFFLDSNLAASFLMQIQQHMVSEVRHSGIVGMAGLTWY